MSVLKRGDEALHYSDGSHRWTSPTGDDETWRARMDSHLAAHREAPAAGRTPGRGLGRGRRAMPGGELK